MSSLPISPRPPRPLAKNSPLPSPSPSPADPNDRSFYSDRASTIAGSPRTDSAPPLPTMEMSFSESSTLSAVFFRPTDSIHSPRSSREIRPVTQVSAISSALTDYETDEDRKYLGSAGRDSNIPPPPPAKDEGYVSRSPTGSSLRKDERISVKKPVLKFVKIGGLSIELSPQPSDDPEDPLNWSAWKKTCTFYSLLFFATLTTASKSALFATSSFAATNFNTRYTALASLTGTPLILSSLTALLSLSLSRILGKRPIFLGSAAIFILGILLSMSSNSSLGVLTAGRIFTGLATGPFDVLLLSTIYDLFFEHERRKMVSIYLGFTVATLWLSPLIGAAGVQNTSRFTLPFEVIAGLFFLAVPLLFFAVHETSYSRSWSSEPSVLRVVPEETPRTTYKESLTWYLQNPPAIMPFYGTGASWDNIPILMRAPRALVAPTTISAALLLLLPVGGLWGFSANISFIFADTLSTRQIGQIYLGAFLLAVPATIAATLHRTLQRGSIVLISGLATAGTILSFIALLALGLSLSSTIDTASLSDSSSELILKHTPTSAGVAVLLALLATGTSFLTSVKTPIVSLSAQSSSASLYDGLTNTVDMASGVTIWTSFFTGIITVGMAGAMQTTSAAAVVQSQGVSLGVVSLFLGAGVVAAWWFKGEDLRMWDSRVMALVNISDLARSGSFFEKD